MTTGLKSSGMKLLTVVVMAIALFAFATPAIAHHKDGHDKGNSSSNRQNGNSSDHDGDGNSDDGVTTEDNDTNDPDPENRADEGDNKHPSGKDRSVENSPDSNPNNGKAESDPDGDGNNGKDKPGGSGGNDLADQDGNNGCGNDDDFEDDNNGNCGGKKKLPQPTVKGKAEDKKDDDSVLGDVITKPVSAPLGDVIGRAAPDRPEADVLGVRMQRGDRVAPAVAGRARVRGKVLPFTGSDLIRFVLIALGLLGSGCLMLRRVRA
jgi:hypothetical protein